MTENSIKDIEIIPLAKRKMERRGIPEAWVSEAIRNADQVVEGHGGRWKHIVETHEEMMNYRQHVLTTVGTGQRLQDPSIRRNTNILNGSATWRRDSPIWL